MVNSLRGGSCTTAVRPSASLKQRAVVPLAPTLGLVTFHMNYRNIATLAILLAATSWSFGQSLVAFGFELGKPLDLPECPFKMSSGIKLYEIAPSNTCAEEAKPLNGYDQPVRRITFSQTEAPVIVKNWRAFPLEEDGNLIGLHFLTPGANAQQVVLDQFKEKYGPPTRVTSRQLQNAMGASFEAISAVWQLPLLRISFEGITGKIETGEVFIDTPPAVALREKWAKGRRTNERKF